jgi:hypothetical protein
MALGNGQSARYRSIVTNELRKVTGRYSLLITRIRNGYETTTVTTTNHWSCEMTVCLGPQRTLVTGTKTKPVTGTQHQRRVLWNCVSDVSTKWDVSISRASHTTRIRNGHQTTTVTTISHRSRENDCFSGPTGNFGNGHQNRAYYCEINIGDACGEPGLSRRTGHVVGPTGQYW